MLKRLRHFLKDETGATAVEYGIMLTLILLVCLVGIQAVGSNVSASFNDSNSELGSKLKESGVNVTP